MGKLLSWMHGDIYACSSLMGKSEYKLGNVYTGRCPENVRKVGAFIRNSMKGAECVSVFHFAGEDAFPDGLIRRTSKAFGSRMRIKKIFIKRYLKRQEKAI